MIPLTIGSFSRPAVERRFTGGTTRFAPESGRFRFIDRLQAVGRVDRRQTVYSVKPIE
jgi:hypothetical protein